MAALLGQAVQPALGPGVNARLSSELDGYAEEIQTAAFFTGHIAPGNALNATTLPRLATALRRPITGQAMGSYAEDFYFRLHISQAALDLGNILSLQQREISVWNAFVNSAPKTLLEIDGANTEGLQIAGPALPASLAPNAEITWLLTIQTVGPFRIDTVLTWQFGSGESVSLSLTGTRITPWPVTPDWSEGVRERLEWSTDVMTARTGASQRRKLRQFPRRALAFDVLTTGQERRALDALLWDFGSRVWALPVWPDGQSLPAPVAVDALEITAATAGRDFRVDGLAILWSAVNRWEVVEISAVEAQRLVLKRPTLSAWGVGTRFWPLRTARLTQPGQQTLFTDTAGTISLDFQWAEPAQWPAVAPSALYLGWPVAEVRPDRGEDGQVTADRAVSTLDGGLLDPVVRDHGGIGFTRASQFHRVAGRSAQADMRSLLYWLGGRYSAAWVPSWNADLVPVATLVGTALQVEWAGYSRFGRQQMGRRDIRIERVTGVVSYHRITGSSEAGDSEQLSIDPQIAGSLDPAQIRQISFMALSSLASDSVEILHQTDSDGIADLSLEFEAVADEL